MFKRPSTDLKNIYKDGKEDFMAQALLDAENARYKNKNLLFLDSIKRGDVATARKIMESKPLINYQDEHGMTALHYAAAMGSRPCIRLLVNSGLCDYTIQDNKGRYASELAFEYARDYAVGVLLSKKQIKAEISKR